MNKLWTKKDDRGHEAEIVRTRLNIKNHKLCGDILTSSRWKCFNQNILPFSPGGTLIRRSFPSAVT